MDTKANTNIAMQCNAKNFSYHHRLHWCSSLTGYRLHKQAGKMEQTTSTTSGSRLANHPDYQLYQEPITQIRKNKKGKGKYQVANLTLAHFSTTQCQLILLNLVSIIKSVLQTKPFKICLLSININSCNVWSYRLNY